MLKKILYFSLIVIVVAVIVFLLSGRFFNKAVAPGVSNVTINQVSQ